MFHDAGSVPTQYSNMGYVGYVTPRYTETKIYETRARFNSTLIFDKPFCMFRNYCLYVRGAVTKFPELWYSTVMVGHMTKLI